MRFLLAEILGDIGRLLAVYLGGTADRGGNRPRVAVVMGAQVLPGGRPSPALESRVRHAARLYRSGALDLIIPTGGLGDHPPSEAELMLRVLRREGVPEEAVLPEDEALNTWDSAVLVGRLARKRGIENVLIVTDPLHCVRTVGAFEEAGLAASAGPVYDNPMWRKPLSRAGQLVREGVALVWYRVRYRIGSRSRR